MERFLKVTINEDGSNLSIESKGLSVIDRAGIISYLQMDLEVDFVVLRNEKIKLENKK